MTLGGPKKFLLKNREIFFHIFMSCMKVGERLKLGLIWLINKLLGPCDFSVSPSPFGLDFGTLDLGLWTWARQ